MVKSNNVVAVAHLMSEEVPKGGSPEGREPATTVASFQIRHCRRRHHAPINVVQPHSVGQTTWTRAVVELEPASRLSYVYSSLTLDPDRTTKYYTPLVTVGLACYLPGNHKLRSRHAMGTILHQMHSPRWLAVVVMLRYVVFQTKHKVP
jgi:hypothetical protein